MLMIRSHPERASRHGFTLVELLVVIGIIALLVGILLPVLGKARQAANAVNCASNLRQIATGWVLYANDHDGRAMPHNVVDTGLRDWLTNTSPSSREWCFAYVRGEADEAFQQGLLAPYLDGITAIAGCPSYDTPAGYDPSFGLLQYPTQVHYGYNGLLLSIRKPEPSGFVNWQGLSLAQVGGSERVIFADSAQLDAEGFAAPQKDIFPPRTVPGPPTTVTGSALGLPSVHARHGSEDRANTAWADGHVSSEVVKFYDQPDPEHGLAPQSDRTIRGRIGFLDPNDDDIRDNHYFFVR